MTTDLRVVEVNDENNPRFIGLVPNLVLKGVVKYDHLENVDHIGDHGDNDDDGDLIGAVPHLMLSEHLATNVDDEEGEHEFSASSFYSVQAVPQVDRKAFTVFRKTTPCPPPFQ